MSQLEHEELNLKKNWSRVSVNSKAKRDSKKNLPILQVSALKTPSQRGQSSERASPAEKRKKIELEEVEDKVERVQKYLIHDLSGTVHHDKELQAAVQKGDRWKQALSPSKVRILLPLNKQRGANVDLQNLRERTEIP